MSERVMLICPKCGSDMRTYERNGVTVDQCTGCRGLFLDRGELERLVDAEDRYYDDREGGRERRDDESGRQRSKKSRKRSFLENLFEGD